jgi:hypothetical protein
MRLSLSGDNDAMRVMRNMFNVQGGEDAIYRPVRQARPNDRAAAVGTCVAQFTAEAVRLATRVPRTKVADAAKKEVCRQWGDSSFGPA